MSIKYQDKFMRIKFIIYFLIIYSSCISQEKKAIDSIFDQTSKIEIYAYLDYNKWDKNDKKGIVNSGEISISDSYLRNKIFLTKKQTIDLKNSLLKTNEKIQERADCYDPRHTIVFYNHQNKILGFINLCFSCNNSESSENLVFLSDKMLFQDDLFKDFGITYFEETEEEKKELKRKREKQERELDEKFKKTTENKN